MSGSSKVKEKAVGQIELFYDLIYVYAISRLTILVEEPKNGVIPFSDFLTYLVVALVILQAWLYMTNYVNRYGQWKWHEYLLIAGNMIGAVYMTNTISKNWNEMTLTFNLSMLVMLVCVWLLYFIQLCLKQQDAGAAKNSLVILTVDCLLYFAAFLASIFHADSAVIWMDAVAVLVGAFLPFFVRGHFDISIISFPHLAERFELLTIVTFGEGVVGMTEYFDVQHFSMRPILTFTVILLLFGCYMLQLHSLCSHKRVERALRLMFTHYFILIALNLVTVGFHFLENPEADRMFTACLMIVSLAVFFTSILIDSAYYSAKYRFTGKDAGIAFASLAAGAAVMLVGRNNTYFFLIGELLAVLGTFCMLLWKWKHPRQAAARS
ncbi:hypothetical protein lacNasYZ03_18960 [Lactobacillus nasalidis]|uniref:Low temperature requirement protein A n=1 Tax=Lactobacillus nasalidis TaxID=2797258 RepID=A0ABQ3W8V8_9LACO|nr:low temperature requirement protein A [Lactobacillus nasalidis]GHV97810.1 hypothetical protein lacNasYZ01_09920 [Lactobacillus nasalidis]GHV99765.1 hypothetical protein lacNasYZ02_11950 [Lactobacillus nasalidis]GHW02209.1 hypothetical protein lacNasYZ03_18960 [Lactobacillus nasalidis]